MLRVRDLLTELDLRLLAGGDAVEAPVRWVHISELSDPTEWLSGGEVLLTTGMTLTDAADQAQFVERLADRGLAALGFATGFGSPSVPAAIVEAASKRGFPVFEVPYEVPFIAVTEYAFTQLVNEQYALLQRALRSLERLERIVLSQRGLPAIVTELGGVIDASVLVFDRRGSVLAGGGFEDAVSLGDAVRDRVRRRERQQFMPVPGALALPVGGDGEALPDAWLVAWKDGAPLSDFDRLLLRQAVTIVALELLRARVAVDTERRLAGDVLSAMAAGELRGDELARRLEPFGLSGAVACLVSEADLEDVLRGEGEPALVATVGELECALVPGRTEEALVELAARVSAVVDATVGVGRAVAPPDARRAFHEARCALEAVSLGLAGDRTGGSRPNGAGNIATYRDLGSFQLLLSLQDDEALRLFCDSILGPLGGRAATAMS